MDLNLVKPLIELAISEDVGSGDVTSQAIVGNVTGVGTVVCKDIGVICGIEIAKLVFSMIDSKLSVKTFFKDGDSVKVGDKILEVSGSAKSLLTAERTVLNFLTIMSGVSSTTRKYVDELKGTNTKLLDTRKTIPGFRVLHKYAVKVGGGVNHRMGLFDMVLIKNNHIRVAGSITSAVKSVVSKYGRKFKIEVECENISMVKEALSCGVDMIMLDNMDVSAMKDAVKFIDGRVSVEASGGITLSNIHEVGLTGVNFISCGAITHSFKNLDLSMRIITNEKN